MTDERVIILQKLTRKGKSVLFPFEKRYLISRICTDLNKLARREGIEGKKYSYISKGENVPLGKIMVIRNF